MKRSEMLRLTALADNIDYKHLTPARLKSLLLESGIKLNAFYQELEMEHPFVEIWRGSDPFSDMESLHSHSFYEIICCTEGGAQYLLETSRCHITQGDLLVIPPGISHRRLPLIPDLPYALYGRYGMWLNAGHLRLLGQNFPGLCLPQHTPRILRAKEIESQFMTEHFFKGWEETEKGMQLSHAAIYGEAILFLTKLCRAIQNSQEAPLKQETDSDLLGQILVYIDASLSERITLAKTASLFFVSESYITHQFRHKIGMSFYQYVTQRRLIFAKMLIEKGIALKQAAQSAGFSSYSNFYRAFLKEYGIAPSGYRKLWQENQSLIKSAGDN